MLYARAFTFLFIARRVAFCSPANASIETANNTFKWPTVEAFLNDSILTDYTHDILLLDDGSEGMRLILEERAAVSQVLEWFVDRLKSFVNNREFRKEAFIKVLDYMQEDLNNVIERILEIPTSVNLTRQLNFAAYFYSEMKGSANVLSIYGDNSIEIRLVRWIVYIHLTLLSLFNLHGIPDPTTPGYIEIIERLRRLLAFWGSLFSELRGVLPPVATVFEDKLSQAEKVLIYLEQHFFK
ncbi:hypothetical protein METSCH_B11930 [Metschnikowia aff. pulcherrima]|uniref:Uncharacterized protein n=1 Tax=Metschnikowia aff. pulcherrima TaxID=2163413 RepID=A0A4P6XMB3_9ASCO|nr:hypothetical protein METSCH_B11930 [Metschnikowia aff. pulcherrima]